MPTFLNGYVCLCICLFSVLVSLSVCVNKKCIVGVKIMAGLSQN